MDCNRRRQEGEAIRRCREMCVNGPAAHLLLTLSAFAERLSVQKETGTGFSKRLIRNGYSLPSHTYRYPLHPGGSGVQAKEARLSPDEYKPTRRRSDSGSL